MNAIHLIVSISIFMKKCYNLGAWSTASCSFLFVFEGHTTYTVRKKIGEGGFAKVYVADCPEDEITSMIMSSMIDSTSSVALKVGRGLMT